MRTVLVTGGSQGIGLAVAQRLAARGDRVVLVARDPDRLAAAAASLDGPGHSWHALDVSDDSSWTGVSFDSLGGLVCAAGVLPPIGRIDAIDMSSFTRTLSINIGGTVLAIRHALPALQTGNGAIVTFGGGGGTAPLPRYDAYAASKAAVARLTENLASVLAPTRVNCVSPGFVATSIHDATLVAGPDAAGREHFERTEAEVARGGFPATEAAELVELLLGDVPFTGKIVSAQWDPWRDASFRDRLASDKDLGTLRRIDNMLFKAAESP